MSTRVDRDNLLAVDWLFDGLLDFLVPKTPWKFFVRLVVVAALVVAYLIAQDRQRLADELAGLIAWAD